VEVEVEEEEEEEEAAAAQERERKRARRRSSGHQRHQDDRAMACINMYNPDGAAGFGGGPQAPAAAALGPRISFSSDFAVEPPPPVQNRAMSLRCQEEDLNFEFSVGSHPMMAADQLFSKGRILPLKDNGAFAGRPPITTLRDELRGGGDDDDRASAAAGKGSSRWKEMLGLRKALCVGVGGNGPARKDKGGVADADMATADMAASNQVWHFLPAHLHALRS
jgi:hypothetical protein